MDDHGDADDCDGLFDYLQFIGVKQYTYILPTPSPPLPVPSARPSSTQRRCFPAGGLVSAHSVRGNNCVSSTFDVNDTMNIIDDTQSADDESSGGATVHLDIACSLSSGSKCRFSLADMTGVVVWPIALTFAKFASRHAQLFIGRRVMEVGCGVGLNGIHVAQLDTANTVVMSDNNEFAMALAQHNIRLNNIGERVTLQSLDWVDSAVISQRFADGFDIVYGSDLFYQNDSLDILIPTVRALLAKQTSAYVPTFIMAYQHRFTPVTRRLLTYVAQCGFDIAKVVGAQQEAQTDIHLINGIQCKRVCYEDDIPALSPCILFITRARYHRMKNAVAINESCRFYVAHKRRFCAKRPLEGSTLCGHHHSIATERSSACPHCTTLIADVRMSAHIMVCPAAEQERIQQSQPFFSKNINMRAPHELADSDIHVPSSLNNIDLMSLIDKVKSILGKYNSVFNYLSANDNAVHVDSSQSVYNKYNRQRHRLQCEKMIDVMKRHGMFDDRNGVVTVEMGGGKGILSEIIAEKFISTSNNNAATDLTASDGTHNELKAANVDIRGLFLIDRSTFRQKRDIIIRRRTTDIRLARIRLDIADIRLSELKESGQFSMSEKESAADGKTSVIVMAKHACGSATDMSINAALHAVNDGAHIHGIALSTCCHHRCEWSAYCNRSFFTSNGLDHNMFTIICRLSSWASLTDPDINRNRRKKSTEAHKDKTRSSDEHEDEVALDSDDWFHSLLTASAASLSALSFIERVHIGRSCKRLLDLGRTLSLSSADWKAELTEFVPQNITRENIMIVATR